MQLAWETLLAQAHANQAQAIANQAQAIANQTTAEATLLAMRSHASVLQCHGDELQAWALDAHGVADVAKALVESQHNAGDAVAVEPDRLEAWYADIGDAEAIPLQPDRLPSKPTAVGK